MLIAGIIVGGLILITLVIFVIICHQRSTIIDEDNMEYLNKKKKYYLFICLTMIIFHSCCFYILSYVRQKICLVRQEALCYKFATSSRITCLIWFLSCKSSSLDEFIKLFSFVPLRDNLKRITTPPFNFVIRKKRVAQNSLFFKIFPSHFIKDIFPQIVGIFLANSLKKSFLPLHLYRKV